MTAAPSLLDAALALVGKPETVHPCFAPLPERRKIGAHLRALMLSARRYWLDEETTRAAASIGQAHPELLRYNLMNARAPFPKMYLEWPLRVHLEAVGGHPNLPSTPERTGVFIEALDARRPLYRLTPLAIVDGQVYLEAVCVVYDLEGPLPGQEIAEPLLFGALRSGYMQRGFAAMPVDGPPGPIADLTPEDAADFIRQSPLGMAYANGSGALTAEELAFRAEQCRAITEHVRLDFTPGTGAIFRDALTGKYGRAVRDAVPRDLTEAVNGYNGFWRFAISALLLINSRDYVSEQEAKPAVARRMVGGKPLPYLSFRRIGLALPRALVARRLKRGLAESLPRRRHEVQGHWAESQGKGDPACEHVWEPETATRYLCTECGRKRWWREAHERGDASLGYVVSEHTVSGAPAKL